MAPTLSGVVLARPDHPGGGDRKEPRQVAPVTYSFQLAKTSTERRPRVAAEPIRRPPGGGEHLLDEIAGGRIGEVEPQGDVGGGARIEHGRRLRSSPGLLSQARKAKQPPTSSTSAPPQPRPQPSRVFEVRDLPTPSITHQGRDLFLRRPS